MVQTKNVKQLSKNIEITQYIRTSDTPPDILYDNCVSDDAGELTCDKNAGWY